MRKTGIRYRRFRSLADAGGTSRFPRPPPLVRCADKALRAFPEAPPLRGGGGACGASSLYALAMVIRRGGRQDVRFLRDMLHHAYYWRERDPGEGPGPVARYVKGWGRPGDTALIAIDEGFPVGAGWYRLFRRDQPGYGFVDEETPELAIAVVPSRRGRGLGDVLLAALCERAQAEGHRALSLSVERDNPALVSFYEKHGFERVAEDGGDSVTMRHEL